MGRKLYFPLSEVAALTEATLSATDWSDSFTDSEDGVRTGPALMWVKDNGTYLMSNALPRFVKVPGVSEADIAVIYGRADSPRGPKVGDGEWDLARDICGGDDFAEYLTVGRDEHQGIGQMISGGHGDGLKWFVIEVGTESLGIGVE